MQNDAFGGDFQNIPQNPWKINYNETTLSDKSWLIIKEKQRSTDYAKNKIWKKIIEYNEQHIQQKIQGAKIFQDSKFSDFDDEKSKRAKRSTYHTLRFHEGKSFYSIIHICDHTLF